MLSGLRLLAWRVVEHSRRVLLLQQQGAALPSRTANTGAQQQFALNYRNLNQQQAVKKFVPGGTKPHGGRGGGGGGLISGPNGGAAASAAVVPASSSPLVGLLGRLGPLVSGAVRRISTASVARRAGSRRSLLYRDTAPLFALVGVTLVAAQDDGEADETAASRKLRGFVTRQEELEAICCSIRDAVSRSGWLYDSPTSSSAASSATSPDPAANTALNNVNEEDVINGNISDNATINNSSSAGVTESSGAYEEVADSSTAGDQHVYCLQDLELAGVIDKGCNAVVYAARWRKPDKQGNSSTNTTTSNSSNKSAGHHNSPADIVLHPITDNSSCSNNSRSNINNRSGTVTEASEANYCSDINESFDSDSSTDTLPAASASAADHASLSRFNNIDSNFLTNLNSIPDSKQAGADSDEHIRQSLQRCRLGVKAADAASALSSSSSYSCYNIPGSAGLLSGIPFSGSTVSLCQPLSLGSNDARTHGVFHAPPPAGAGAVEHLDEQHLEDEAQAGLLLANLGENDAMNDLLNTTLDNGGDVRHGHAAAGLLSHRRYSSSLSEDVSLLLSSGGFGPPTRGGQRKGDKRVRFLPSTESRPSKMRSSGRRSSGARTGGEPNARLSPHHHHQQQQQQQEGQDPPTQAPPPTEEFPLAVKLVFNYEAASNAPAILSALYRELIPARSLQLDELYDSWRSDFFGDRAHCLLPRHPNIVEMPCAFVDRVPLLQGGLQLYPTALPPRLNPDGLGRNMSLFCVMRRYDASLDRYLKEHPRPSPRTSLLLLTQLLEALQHLHHNNISHRDLKPDNILLCLRDGWETPWLVLTDFGCCLAADSPGGLTVPFVSREAEPRQGNAALMAPEVKTARPGLLKSINFSSSDLWAAGTLAYQCYGQHNPFLKQGSSPPLDSGSYRESQLPGLQRSAAPPAIRRLVADLLRRRPADRPSPTVAATLCQLSLWGPSAWLNRHSFSKPKHDQVMEWLLCLTTKVLCERRGSASSGETEFRLVSTFLARVRYTDVLQAIAWNKAF